ncbi:TonB-dependent receptor domain-containing protein [Vibrio hepatarius]|uniref:TonB-dependent receptor domain-containing protein n=1 Tax=Vibrio hepatarius TaxID=171383 RepID=UPI001C09CF20|nr:TonB-dependent receptor [Vibrio hepatarius]MBU2897522.1 TonB-dependent receptor [Vibrio hepatarius]
MNRTMLAMTVASLLPHASLLYAKEISTDETMVVTANRFEQSINSTLAPVVVVTKDEIQSTQAKSIEEVLRRLPGIQVSSSGGYGQLASIYIRGTESDHALVLINGVRVSSATAGSTAIASLPLNGVERIEYVRGPRTSVYGSDAIGGVINIITSYTGDETELWVEAGSDKYQKYAVNTANQVGENGWAKVSVNREKTDGFSATNENSSSFDPDNDGYDHTDLLLELGVKSTEELSFKWNTNYTEGDIEFDSGEQEQKLLSSSIVGAYKTDSLSSEVILATSRDQSSYVGSSDNYETNRLSVAWQNGYQVNSELLMLGGVDWVNDDVSESTTAYAETSRSNLGVYTSGLYSKDKIQAEVSLRIDDNEQYGDYTTWQVGSGYKFTPIYRLSVMAGTAFKAPTFNDLYHPASQWGDYANPDLAPEESLNYEVALDVTPSIGDFRIAFYQNEVSDLISPSSSTDKNENIAKAEIKGLELVGKFATGALFHSASIDVMDTEDKDTGKELARRSKYSAKWNVSYTYYDWNFDLSYLYRGGSYDDAANNTRLDAYSLVDISTHYYITDNLIARGKIANLFDEDYETSYGYNTQERSYFAGLNYKF